MFRKSAKIVALIFGGVSCLILASFVTNPRVNAITPSGESMKTDDSLDVLAPNSDEIAKKKLIQKQKEEFRVASLKKAQQKATQIINNVIAKLNRIRDRVNGMPVISDDQKGELNLKIDERITALGEEKTLISLAENKKDIKAAFKDAKKSIGSTRGIIQKVVESIQKTRLENIIDRLVAVIVKIDDRISKLDEAKKVEEEKNLDEAKGYLRDAKGIIKSGGLLKARENVRKANKLLLDVLGPIGGEK